MNQVYMAVWRCIQVSLPRISLLNQVSNLKSRFPDWSRSGRELPITLPRRLVNLSLETFSLQKTNQPGGLGKVASYIRYHVCSRITNLITKLFRHASKAYLRFVQNHRQPGQLRGDHIADRVAMPSVPWGLVTRNVPLPLPNCHSFWEHIEQTRTS